MKTINIHCPTLIDMDFAIDILAGKKVSYSIRMDKECVEAHCFTDDHEDVAHNIQERIDE